MSFVKKLSNTELMMSKEEILETYADIFRNLEEYALVKQPGDHQAAFKIMHKTDMTFVPIKESLNEVTGVMIELGVQIVDAEEQLTLPDYKTYTEVWNEEKQGWEKVQQEAFIKILDERNKSRE